MKIIYIFQTVSKNLAADGFGLAEETSQFHEDFIKSSNEESNEGLNFEVDTP